MPERAQYTYNDVVKPVIEIKFPATDEVLELDVNRYTLGADLEMQDALADLAAAHEETRSLQVELAPLTEKQVAGLALSKAERAEYRRLQREVRHAEVEENAQSAACLARMLACCAAGWDAAKVAATFDPVSRWRLISFFDQPTRYGAGPISRSGETTPPSTTSATSDAAETREPVAA